MLGHRVFADGDGVAAQGVFKGQGAFLSLFGGAC